MNATITTTTTSFVRPASATSTSVRNVRAAIRSEWIKVRSVRSTPIFVGLATVIGVGMAMILGKAVKTDPYDHLPFTIGNTLVVSSWLTTLFAMVAGTLIFTTEVQYGTLAGALVARPSKPAIVGAKVTVAAALGFVMGALGIIGSLIGGVASGMDTGDTSGAPAAIGWALVLTTFAPIIGLGIGLIVRHSAAAVTAVLVWALAVENLVRGMAPASVSRLLPFSAANGLLGARSLTDTSETLAAQFSNVGNAAVFGFWAIATVVIGTALLNRKDV